LKKASDYALLFRLCTSTQITVTNTILETIIVFKVDYNLYLSLVNRESNILCAHGYGSATKKSYYVFQC